MKEHFTSSIGSHVVQDIVMGHNCDNNVGVKYGPLMSPRWPLKLSFFARQPFLTWFRHRLARLAVNTNENTSSLVQSCVHI